MMVKFNRGALADEISALIGTNPAFRSNQYQDYFGGYSRMEHYNFYGDDTIKTKLPKKTQKEISSEMSKSKRGLRPPFFVPFHPK